MKKQPVGGNLAQKKEGMRVLEMNERVRRSRMGGRSGEWGVGSGGSRSKRERRVCMYEGTMKQEYFRFTHWGNDISVNDRRMTYVCVWM